MLQSINPYSSQKVYEVREYDEQQINEAIDRADERYRSWKKVSFPERKKLMLEAARELRKNKEEYATAITEEMGKPITQSLAEVEKCAWVCEYYAAHAEKQLSDKSIETEAYQSYVSYEPIGVVLAVMPWNFPFWQVFRFAAPALMAGNTGLLKHASNVMKSAGLIEEVFRRAGFPDGCFTNLPISSKKVEHIIENDKVKAVTLTGSEMAGRAVAAAAGSRIKKTVLELGGSNALVVFDDCNLEETVRTCVQARFQNAGQSCIAGKRLLLQAAIAEKFTEKFVEAVRNLETGDPMDKDTYLGTLAREDLAEDLEKQLQESVEKGAEIRTGGKRDKAFFEPTVVVNVTEEMPVFKEETFGPLMAITVFDTEEEAIALVNKSRYGLGVSVFTESLERARSLVPEFDDGAVFVNELVKSDPRLPFGGTKSSGYGRELSVDGIREFVNKKTVYIHKY
ncbi:NAD-dependent succinate-semialdehyde dehydrogenase [Sinomicrobium soli]|uniref:NAD-dependent succinate-semialdehyde dehydrogenase n=1 Tax=Sinomicrobium sp. N-1-3-6 TaxID=2219864 RepID=UPI000DCE1194|nr:NAD-dependent succinate-semialdehyde dehydrogenase [Sinomicrobium sp. N-1-3-6]RAV28648.1 NAD-dependent succinate-semialdehyde dehydrogenase [Sinomicrobium sp. N-1-3-6]